MARKSTGKRTIQLTERALRDIAEIETYSIEQFGKRVANEYVAKLEAGLTRIAMEPGLLRVEPTFHETLQFYRVEKHLLVCETGIAGQIIVLAVIHGSMDISTRLAELEPKLALELEFMLEQLKRTKK